MKQEMKDLRGKFSPRDFASLRGKQIKKFGQTVWSLPKNGVKKLKSGWGKIKSWAKGEKEQLESYADSERQEYIDKKTDKLDQKITGIEYSADRLQMSAETETEKAKIAPYLEVAQAKIDRLKEKKVKISNRGKGIFALSLFALKKVTTNGVHNAQKKIKTARENAQERREERREAREQTRQEREVERIRRDNQKIASSLEQMQEIMRTLQAQLQYNMERLNNLYQSPVEEQTAPAR